MTAIAGILIVLGAIVDGYLIKHGQLLVLFQPAELVIIFGAALGTVIVANPVPTIIKIVNGLIGILGGNPFGKAFYTDNLKMMFELFNHVRKNGTAKLEEDVDNPFKSQISTKYPKFLKNHHALDFLCDTLRMAVSGGVEPLDIDTMTEVDLEVHTRESHLFIVLWLISADEETKQQIAACINNPNGTGAMTGTAAAGIGNAIEVPKDDMQKIQKALATSPNFRNLKDHVEITITADGLRIELLETEGNTDSRPFAGAGEYSNWELSSDRANAARRIMQEHGIRAEQVGQVRGFGDRQLRKPAEPDSLSNRRISVIVQYMKAPAEPAPANAGEHPPEGSKSQGHEAAPHEPAPQKAPAAPAHR